MTSLNKALGEWTKRAAEAEKRIAESNAAQQDVSPLQQPAIAIEESFPDSKAYYSSKGMASKIVACANDKLIQAEQLGLFDAYLVKKTRMFPTLLARLPIFLPGPASRQKHLLDDDLSYRFSTPFGRGRRFGPPVNIEDEEILFAMLRLSEKRLIGSGPNLPIPLDGGDLWLKDEKSGHVTVQVAVATVGQINAEAGLTKAGNNYKNTLASVKRLNQISIELETRKQEMYLGESWNGDKIRLVDIQWKAYQQEGLIYAQFTPIMVKWLKEQATYYNWEIRRKLTTSNGRALHRFLSTQGQSYTAPLTYIADTIEWHGDRKRLRPRMESVLKDLRDNHNWCDFEITGKGRVTPFVLNFVRRRTTQQQTTYPR